MIVADVGQEHVVVADRRVEVAGSHRSGRGDQGRVLLDLGSARAARGGQRLVDRGVALFGRRVDRQPVEPDGLAELGVGLGRHHLATHDRRRSRLAGCARPRRRTPSRACAGTRHRRSRQIRMTMPPSTSLGVSMTRRLAWRTPRWNASSCFSALTLALRLRRLRFQVGSSPRLPGGSSPGAGLPPGLPLGLPLELPLVLGLLTASAVVVLEPPDPALSGPDGRSTGMKSRSSLTAGLSTRPLAACPPWRRPTRYARGGGPCGPYRDAGRLDPRRGRLGPTCARSAA